MIGLKAPGAQRGIWHGKLLIDTATRRAAMSSLLQRFGLTVRRADLATLPVVEVQVPSAAVLSQIRKLPFIDYIEPAHIEITPASGCGPEPLTRAIITVVTSNGGLDTLSQIMPRMGIPDAWQYSTGSGTTLGITDSGVDEQYPAAFSEAHYATVDSYGRRPFWQQSNGNGPDLSPACDHGTREANIAAAPRDGRGIVGVAYRASVYSNYFEDFPLITDEYSAAVAIYASYNNGRANVIMMAWWGTTISDAIDAFYYGNDVVFVGAAGTCHNSSDDCPGMGSAVFPAEKGEVLAATGTNWEGTRPHDNYDWGSKIEGVLSYTRVASVGIGGAAAELNGSSAPTGVIAGVAALVRSRYPYMSNHDVVHRILDTDGDKCHDPPPQWRNSMVNAVAAVGGPCLSHISGPTGVGPIAKPTESATAHFSVTATGDNSANYTYRWSNNAPGSSISYTFWANFGWTSYTMPVTVAVTDPATGVQASRTVNVYVRAHDPDPPCGPGVMC